MAALFADGKIQVEMKDRFFRSFGKEDPVDYFEMWLTKGSAVARSG